jgi:hypothetical protein
MKLSKWIAGAAVAAALLVGGPSIPAFAAGAHGLPWRSPAKITSGVPFHVASIAACPPVPTPGDSVLVEIDLSFGPGGGSGDVIAAQPNGSWSGTLTFFFDGVSVRQTTISAECLDFNGVTGVPYAQYMVRHTQVFD